MYDKHQDTRVHLSLLNDMVFEMSFLRLLQIYKVQLSLTFFPVRNSPYLYIYSPVVEF